MPGYIPGPGREKVLRALFKPTIDIHPRNHLAVHRNTPQKDMQNPTSQEVSRKVFILSFTLRVRAGTLIFTNPHSPTRSTIIFMQDYRKLCFLRIYQIVDHAWNKFWKCISPYADSKPRSVKAHLQTRNEGGRSRARCLPPAGRSLAPVPKWAHGIYHSSVLSFIQISFT